MHKIKRWISKKIPDKLRIELFLFLNYAYFYKRMRKYSSIISPNKEDAFAKDTQHLMYSHSIEKGLSLKTPRPNFGSKLIGLLDAHLKSEKVKTNWISKMLQGVLSEYKDFNNSCNDSMIKSSSSWASSGGTKSIKKAEFVNRKCFSDFAKSRHSVRNFTGEKVSYDEILKAVEVAQTAPSVCNRQSIKVRVFYGEKMEAILKLQNGNKGFGEDLGALLVITSDIKSFFYPTELNQAYIDGGLFSMLLSLSLHDLGYGVCMLNWCVSSRIDRKFRNCTPIKNSEVVVMLMAVGVIPEKLKVAFSQRRPPGEITKLEDD